MQLATFRGSQPWICTLHFVADQESNIYWISKSTRRHSEDIAKNPQVAVAIAVHTEKPLIGVQAEGSATIISDADDARKIMDIYIDHHGTDKSFAQSIVDGTNEHKVYKFAPTRFSLFDLEHFASQSPVEWTVNK